MPHSIPALLFTSITFAFMSLQISGLTYHLPTQDTLFSDISLSIATGTKCTLIGNNGTGKSTLLRILAGQLIPSAGNIIGEVPYLVPQHFGQYNNLSVSEALGIAKKLNALNAITNGDASENNFETLNDDWTIESRIHEAFLYWDISHITPATTMNQLSGGEKTKIFLAGIQIHRSQTILMDEPTNHLDQASRKKLYEFIASSPHTMLIVTHDRELLDQASSLYELSASGLRYFPMSYNEYTELVTNEAINLENKLNDRQKELTKAKREARTAMERQLKRNSRGEKHSLKKGLSRIALGNLAGKSETTTARLKSAHNDKIATLTNELNNLQSTINNQISLNLNLVNSHLPKGKTIVEARNLNISLSNKNLWAQPLNLTIRTGTRLWIKGRNGSGKSTLTKLIANHIAPTTGTISVTENINIIYLDQDYSLISGDLTVYDQLCLFNTSKEEHELKTLLHHFQFTKESWHKPCQSLSGGEKMKLALCGLILNEQPIDLLMLDEPTNNLDLSSLSILTNAINLYTGTVVIITHDTRFAQNLNPDSEYTIN